MMSVGVMGLIALADHGRNLFQVVPDDVKHMWNEWALRGLILISLASQVTLTLLGNARKYNPRTRVRMALWSSYLLAYAVASAALGVITRTALDVCISSRPISEVNKLNTSELMSFWAPFLLLHIGGPDAITAFALEDNELSLRHFVEILFQSVVALYILLLSWPGCSDLPQLSILVYLAGFIKCFERVQALRLANSENLRDSMLGPPDPGPNYPKFLEDLHLKKSQGFRTSVEEVPEPPLPAYDHAYPEGAILLEIVAVITMLRSDWTDHWLSQRNLTRNILVLPFLKNPTKRRWSGSIAQFDLLSVALEENPACFLQIQKFIGKDKV